MSITLTREEAQQVLDALYSMNGTEFLCQAAHHPKKDMHKSGEVCPVAARYMEARETLRARLQKPEHWSDCAVHSEPAYPAGECDCGLVP